MKKSSPILILILLCFALQANAQENKRIDQKFEMKTYYLVFLKKGDVRTQDTATVNKLQAQHLEHLTKMYDDGKMDICGPLLEDGDIRGICIYNVASAEEATKLANDDPMVKSGRLKVEVHPFYSAKGVSLK